MRCHTSHCAWLSTGGFRTLTRWAKGSRRSIRLGRGDAFRSPEGRHSGLISTRSLGGEKLASFASAQGWHWLCCVTAPDPKSDAAGVFPQFVPKVADCVP